MEVLGEIFGGIMAVWFFIWWTFGGRTSPTYWRCSAGHSHQTPAAARDCSLAQRL
jgi:hypothetical protein